MTTYDELFDAEKDNSTPDINLFNFEDPKFEDSKYVLTSPRSLEACARVGVKPVNLLYKPLSDFQEELLPQDVPLRTIYNIYDEHEQDRQRKLRLCRSERNKIEIVPQTKKTPRKPRGKSSIGRSQSARSPAARSRLTRTLSDEGLNKSKGSLQRNRTAWATSVGHKRVTPSELNQRMTDLHEESMKLRNELLSRKERPGSARASKKSSIKRSKSASSLSLSGTSLLNKSTIREARPIENTKLRKTLSQSQDLSNITATPRDQRILELMMMKGEGEISANRDRFIADLAWEEQHKLEEEVKVRTEMKRRQLLAEENRIRDMKKKQKDRRRKKEEEKWKESVNREIQNSYKDWERRSQTQLRMRDLQMSDRKEKEDLKKRLQETNKSFLTRDEEEMKELIRMKSESDLKSASQKKENRLLQETMRKLLEDRSKRDAFEQRQRELEKLTEKEEQSLKSSINRKHRHASLNHQQAIERRDKELNLSRMERERKSLHAKLAQQKLEDEMDEWRSSITDHRKMAEEHASEIVARKMDIKAKQAHETRTEKEQQQKEKLKLLEKEDRLRRREVEDEISIKEQRARSVELDKSITIQKSREVAHQSQILRNSLREKYGGESFDKKVQKVNLYSKLKLGQYVPQRKV
ncbi:coiled-coil domain-containing protein 177-like [Saccostrea echinata]|uniref:coiled-coil domain-containing protein 177-like n=1 Tax=Saccostrea echinata TaxID=191078 RepID=UPI002A80507F|nr:coiled-coil domain-containing protein 177-like [Saccostrea echinata]